MNILTIYDALRIMNVEIILIAVIDVASGNRSGFRSFPIRIFILFTHSTKLLSTTCVPDIVLVARDTAVNKIQSPPRGTSSLSFHGCAGQTCTSGNRPSAIW